MNVPSATDPDDCCSQPDSMEANACLAAAYAAGRHAWGDLGVSYAQFAAYTGGLELAGPAVTTRASDLYLCTACAAGQAQAYQALEAAHFPALRALLVRLLADRVTAQELLQELRIRLFVGATPRITTYRGSGSLFAWLRTIAIHAARDYMRARSVQRGRLLAFARAQHERGSASQALGERDPLLCGQRRERLLERACSAAIATLERSQLQLLRHYYVAGLSIDDLSPMYSVHRATIARRIRRAVEHIRAFARHELAARYQLSGPELDELVQESCAEIDLSEQLRADEAPHAA